MIVCLAANPSIDKLFEIDRLVRGDIHRPDGFVQTAGGKGLNVARAAHALGAEVHGDRHCCGDTPGSGSSRQLAAEGVPSVPVWTHGENRSSLSVADRETRRAHRVLRARVRGAVGRLDRTRSTRPHARGHRRLAHDQRVDAAGLAR